MLESSNNYSSFLVFSKWSVEKAYILPFVIYLIGTSCAGQFPVLYPILYALVVLLSGASLYWSSKQTQLFQVHWRVLDAVGIGILGILLWIWLCSLNLEAMLTSDLPEWLRPEARTAFEPFDELSLGMAWGFIAIRLAGLAVIVPMMEELFWRGFLARWLVSENWAEVPLGRFTVRTFVIVTVLFTLAHPEWIAAATYCSLLNLFLIWRKDLWSCIVAHGTSNLLLGFYVLWRGAYQLW